MRPDEFGFARRQGGCTWRNGAIVPVSPSEASANEAVPAPMFPNGSVKVVKSFYRGVFGPERRKAGLRLSGAHPAQADLRECAGVP